MGRRVIVDAMNLIGSRPDGWWHDPGRAMRALASELDDFAERAGEEVTVVFDSDPGGLPDLRYIRVVVARRRGRNAADHEIEQMVSADERPESLTVVTSDRKLMESVHAAGAKTIGSGTFRARLEGIDGDDGQGRG